MADYGAQDTSTTSLGANQFPISEAWTPNAGFSAVEGGTQTTDAGGKKSAPVRIEVKDGSDLTQGLTTDAAVTGDNSGTLSAKLRGLTKIFTDIWDSVNHRIKVDGSGVTQPVSGTVSVNALPAGSNLIGSVELVDSAGTNKAAIDSAGNQVIKGNYLEVPFTTTTAQVVASTDAANYRWVEVIITSQGTSSTVTFQASGNNSAYVSTALQSINSQTGSATALTSVATGIWHGPLGARYFQLNVTGISAGTTAGIVRFHTLPSVLPSMTVSASQNGTWTVQPGNTANTTAWKVDGSGVAQPVAVFNGSVNQTWSAVDNVGDNSHTGIGVIAQSAYNGNPNYTYDRLRIANVFKTATATATGDTAVWTPTAGTKFRIMAYAVYVTQNAAISGGGLLEILLRDATTSLGLGFSVYCPSAAGTTFGAGASSGWVLLGNGKLSATINNALNVNLSATLTAGEVRVVAIGMEE